MRRKCGAVASSLRVNCSDNLACGANISCLSFWVCAGLPTRASGSGQWSMPNVSGQRSMVSERCMLHGVCPPRHTRILSCVSVPTTPKVLFQMSVNLSHQLLCVIARPMKERATPGEFFSPPPTFPCFTDQSAGRTRAGFHDLQFCQAVQIENWLRPMLTLCISLRAFRMCDRVCKC